VLVAVLAIWLTGPFEFKCKGTHSFCDKKDAVFGLAGEAWSAQGASGFEQVEVEQQ